MTIDRGNRQRRDSRQPRALSDASPLLLTVEQAAKRLQVNRNLIYQLIHRGELKSMTIGRTRRILLQAPDDFVASRLNA